MQGVYKIENKINGKLYIGSSVNIESRLKSHIKELNNNSHNNNYLQNAWNKYGENNFIFEVIEVVEDKNYLREREQYYIDIYKVTDHSIGYNILPNTNIGLGVKASKEVRSKISDACRGAKNGHYGMKHSEETKKHISDIKKVQSAIRKKAKLDDWISEKHLCEVCGKIMTKKYGSGRFCSKACSYKSISIKNKAIPHTKEWNKKVSNALTGKEFSKEHCAKISEVAKTRLKDSTKNPMYGKHHSEETRIKISESLKSIEINSSRFAGHKHTNESKLKISNGVRRAKNDKK